MNALPVRASLPGRARPAGEQRRQVDVDTVVIDLVISFTVDRDHRDRDLAVVAEVIRDGCLHDGCRVDTPPINRVVPDAFEIVAEGRPRVAHRVPDGSAPHSQSAWS